MANQNEKKNFICESKDGKINVRQGYVDFPYTIVKQLGNGSTFAVNDQNEYFSFAKTEIDALNGFSYGINSLLNDLQKELKMVNKLNSAIDKTLENYFAKSL